MTTLSLPHSAQAERGLQMLEAVLRLKPPAGVSLEFIERFFTQHREEILAELFGLLSEKKGESQPESEVVYTTPGTEFRWSTLRGWLAAYRGLKREPPSLANHEAMVQHFLVLPDALVLSASADDLEAFRKVLRWIRPAPEEREDHRYFHLRALLTRARKRLRRALMEGGTA